MISPKLRQYADRIDRDRSRWNRDAQYARAEAAQRQVEQDAADARDRRLARGVVPPAEAAKVWAHVEQIMRFWVYAGKNRCRATNRALERYLREHREYGNLPLELALEEIKATSALAPDEIRWTNDATQKDQDAAEALPSK
jgi:hypothetical protein